MKRTIGVTVLFVGLSLMGLCSCAPPKPSSDIKIAAARSDDALRSTDIAFYSYFPSHADALAFAAYVRKRGFRTEVDAPLGHMSDGTTDRSWSVISRMRAVPSATTIDREEATMETLARRYNGDYDGNEVEL